MEHDQVPTDPRVFASERAPAVSGHHPSEANDQRSRTPAGCPVCGQARLRPGPCANWWCRRADRGFSVVFAVGVHAGGLRHAVLRYKYRRELWWAGVFAGLFAEHLRTPRHLVRGVRPPDPDAGLRGSAGAGGTGIPSARSCSASTAWFDPLWETAVGAVVKRAETPADEGRPWAQRQRIASGPLRRSLLVPAPTRVAGARVLVLDDVLTEGGTLREVAQVLTAGGRAGGGGAGAGPAGVA